jgi:transposase
MDFIGFDLGKVSSQVCIINEGGEIVERRIRTNREQIGKLLSGQPRARILIEASTESEWVARFLEELRHEVVVADTNFAPMYATRRHRVKTDKRDARTLAEAVKGDKVVARLCTVPGVGPVTATSFASTLDDVSRFSDAKQVRAYLGLVPSEYSSGERQQRGGISKAGPSRARSMLVEAGWIILRGRNPATEALHEWGARLAAMRGKKVAAVALARKLAGILYAMWRDGTNFGEESPHALSVAA